MEQQRKYHDAFQLVVQGPKTCAHVCVRHVSDACHACDVLHVRILCVLFFVLVRIVCSVCLKNMKMLLLLLLFLLIFSVFAGDFGHPSASDRLRPRAGPRPARAGPRPGAGSGPGPRVGLEARPGLAEELFRRNIF